MKAKGKTKYTPRPKADAPSMAAVLAEAFERPGEAQACYHQHYPYSAGNKWLIAAQCRVLDIDFGPMGTYNWFHEHGRQVRSKHAAERPGRAMCMAQPYTYQPKDKVTGEPMVDENGEPVIRRGWNYPWRWFVLSQTDPIDGAELPPLDIGEWNAGEALCNLHIEAVPFTLGDGNCMGYATRDRTIAINPINPHESHTLVHELAHIVLGHTEETDMMDGGDLPRDLREAEAEGVAYLVDAILGNDEALAGSRSYLQHWYGDQAEVDENGDVLHIPEKSANRIFKAVDIILHAGGIKTAKGG